MDKDNQNKKPDNTKDEDTTKQIGITVDLSIVGFNGDNPIRAKVDTGAQYCSLHADDLEVITDDITKNSIVKFTYNEYQYKLDVDGFQSVSSADGGTTNRPSVRLSVRLNDQFIQDVVFNLNDRSHMDYPVLIGMNLISAGKFVIDPNINEMDVSFGPEGYKVINSDTDVATGDGIVDKKDEILDNMSLEMYNDSLSTFLRSIKDRSFTEVVLSITQLLQQLPEETDDTSDRQ
jgi:hypothetical protein